MGFLEVNVVAEVGERAAHGSEPMKIDTIRSHASPRGKEGRKVTQILTDTILIGYSRELKTIDLFKGKDTTQCAALIDDADNFRWRYYFVPEHDPEVDPHT
jgi:hypothetical protein